MGDRIVGRVLEGRYRVRERLARGGMSTVYSALDERLDREVAVKVMSAALSTDPAFADRFAREARVAARLSHLNAVSVYDQGADDGHVFLVMELVRGRTLRDLLRERGVLSPAQAVSIMEPVLGALAAAHRAGLVHRDVKPENILLADDGLVKVADFGLARAIESDASNTRTGLMMGTVAYCPPEQISRGNADARSDVYSAGVVLFELLTGSTPYVGDSAMAVAYQHVNSDVPAPSTRLASIPPQLDDVVLRATSREPSGRPLDAGALLAELHDVRVDLGLPVVAVPSRPRPNTDPDVTQVLAAVPVSYPHSPVDTSKAEPHTPAPSWSSAPVSNAAGANPMASAASVAGSAEATTAPTYAGVGLDPMQHTVISERPPGDPPPAQTGARTRGAKPPPTPRQRARRRTTIAVIIILLLGLLTGYGAWYIAVGRYHQVPNLVGQSRSAATSQLVSGGFSVNPVVDQQFSETVAAGFVINTRPGPHAHVLKGKSVQLVVSKGPERFKVPAVAGDTYAQAQRAFTTMPIQLVRSDTADNTGKYQSGLVIRTDPPAAAKVKRDQVVTLFVSTGPPVINVPDVRNKKKDDAIGILKQAGFAAASTDDFSDKVPLGSVISQSPAGSAPAVKFSTVSLVVSKGPEMVTIPNIPAGSDPELAKATLENLGLVVQVIKRNKGLFDFSAYRVDRTDPAAGTQVKKGSTVSLIVK
jgi:serine/threonine protein kinase/beta-lactam-binding protein with PASTA domain